MKDVCDSYLSVRREGHGLYKSLGSRFIAFAYPVQSAQEAMDIVSSLRKQYHDARHCCFAYRLGVDGQIWRYSDDGEPSSSAGKPIISQMMSCGVSDVLVVVVRYFGGVKLGIPGLITAYREASAQALEDAGKVTKYATESFRITFPYDLMSKVMGLLKAMNISFADLQTESFCNLTVSVRLSLIEDFKDRIEEICTLSQKKITLNNI